MVKNWIIAVLAVVVIVGGYLTFTNKGTTVQTVASPSLGDQSHLTGLNVGTGGFSTSGILSTTTPASLTLSPNDIINANFISMFPSVGAITITLPATTSAPMATWLPNPGDAGSFMIHNSTTTAAQTVTVAGGTGTLLRNSTTTAAILPGGIARLTCVRKVNTDIACLFSVAP